MGGWIGWMGKRIIARRRRSRERPSHTLHYPTHPPELRRPLQILQRVFFLLLLLVLLLGACGVVRGGVRSGPDHIIDAITSSMQSPLDGCWPANTQHTHTTHTLPLTTTTAARPGPLPRRCGCCCGAVHACCCSCCLCVKDAWRRQISRVLGGGVLGHRRGGRTKSAARIPWRVVSEGTTDDGRKKASSLPSDANPTRQLQARATPTFGWRPPLRTLPLPSVAAECID